MKFFETLIAAFAAAALAEDAACDTLTACDTCTAQSGCGWCPDDSACVTGTDCKTGSVATECTTAAPPADNTCEACDNGWQTTVTSSGISATCPEAKCEAAVVPGNFVVCYDKAECTDMDKLDVTNATLLHAETTEPVPWKEGSCFSITSCAACVEPTGENAEPACSFVFDADNAQACTAIGYVPSDTAGITTVADSASCPAAPDSASGLTYVTAAAAIATILAAAI